MSTETAHTAGPREVFAIRGMPPVFAAVFLDGLTTTLWLFTLGWVATRSGGITTGAILFAAGLPYALVLLFGGDLVDRVGSAGLAPWTLTARAVVMGVWAVVAIATTSAYILTVTAIVVGAIGGFHETALFSYPTNLLTGRAENQVSAAMERGVVRLSQGAGGFVAGGLTAAGSISWTMAAAAVFAIVAAALIWPVSRRMPAGDLTTGDETTAHATADPDSRRLSQGWRFIGSHPTLRITLGAQTLVSAVGAILFVLALPLKTHQEAWGVGVDGMALGALGIGMLIGVGILLWLQSRGNTSQLRLAMLCCVLGGCASIVVALAWSPGALVVSSAVAGLVFGPVGPTLSGHLRAEADDAETRTGEPVVGRAISVMLLMTDAIEPIALLIAGAATAIWTAGPIIVLGALCAAWGAFGLLRIRA